MGARILKLALDFDKLQAKGVSTSEAFLEVRRRERWYDPNLVEALARTLANEIRYEVRSVSIEDLSSHVILAQDIFSSRGLLLMAKGQEVSGSLRERLKNFARLGVVSQPIKILVPWCPGSEVSEKQPA